jgi:hypothetical protein
MFHPMKKVLVGVAAFAALAFGGSALAGAATSTTTSSTATQSASGVPARPAFNGPAHGTAAHEDAEKPVTGATAGKVQAAAVKSVGSGKAGAVTTDFTQNGYEVTVTKADGSQVEVHLNGSLQAFRGGRGGPGGPGMPPGGGGMPGGPGMPSSNLAG